MPAATFFSWERKGTYSIDARMREKYNAKGTNNEHCSTETKKHFGKMNFLGILKGIHTAYNLKYGI